MDLYTNQNIYNKNTFALFQKVILNKILGTKQSTKKNDKKAWIRIDLIYNMNKSHKFKL